jgi:UDP-N-acetylglucosamine 2-epimerase (non-hydrolysing)
MSRKRVLAVFGTRPEAIKMAPLVKALEKDRRFAISVAVTAQHRELLDQVTEIFGLDIKYDLNLMKPAQSLVDITSGVIEKISAIINEDNPDIVLVHGDTTTAFASGLAAFYQGRRIAHVEAGLRTQQKMNPFPEEMNRKLLASIADVHFCPTKLNAENLVREGVDPNQIFVTGNTCIDALNHVLQLIRQKELTPSIVDTMSLKLRDVILVTVHRRENFGKGILNICEAIKAYVVMNPDKLVVFPVHPNPNIRQVVYDLLSETDQVLLTEPIDYVNFSSLMASCFCIMTDSGGIQEEAISLGKPIILLRETTERPEGVAAGHAILAGSDPDAILQALNRLTRDKRYYNSFGAASNPYGDGYASDRILKHLASLEY